MSDNLINKKMKIRFEDGKEISVRYKTKLEDILKTVLTKEELNKILGVKFNNELKTFEYAVVNSGNVRLVSYDDHDGKRIYQRTVKFILFMALKRVYPNISIDFLNNIDNNSYFICENESFDDLMAVNILKEMRQIVANNSNIYKKTVGYEEARALFEAQKDERKVKSIDVKLVSHMTMYFCEDMYNSMYGVLAPNTNLVKDFDIKPFRKGFVLSYKEEKNTKNVIKKLSENKIYDVFEEYKKYIEYTNLKNVADLNENIIKDNLDQIIKVSEAIHNNKLAELLKDIEKRKNLKIILIAGPSSSGKTTFAKRLSTNLKLIGYNAIAIGMDDYYLPYEQRYIKEEDRYECEAVTAVDIKLFNKNVKDLLNSKKVQLPRYNFITGQREESGKFLKLEEKDVLIIEGIHALNPILLKDIEEKYKYKVYLAPITTLDLDDYSKISATDTRMIRRIVRDYNTRGLKVEKTFAMWANIMKGEQKYIYPFVSSADYIFNTSLIYELGALKTFADPLLLGVSPKNKYFAESRRLYGILKNFLPIDTRTVPADSILREFIGNR